jgi:hypothetical protein
MLRSISEVQFHRSILKHSAVISGQRASTNESSRARRVAQTD